MLDECRVYLFQANDNKILSQQFFFMVGGSGADEWVPL
jgi:hypothetical protein